MNNTKTDLERQRNTIELTGIKIDEPETDETNVTIEIQVPFEFYLHGRRDLGEYERIALEDLRIKASAIFEHIRLLNHLVENRDFEQNSFASILYPLTNFGKGLIEAQEIIQMSFERYREGLPQKHEMKAEPEEKAAENTQTPAPSFSKATIEAAKKHIQQVTANKIHHALTSDKVSTEIKVAIEDILITAANETMDVNLYHPDLVKSVFLLIMDELDFNYGKGVLHSIQSILDTLPVEVWEEFEQYEKHISESEETAKQPAFDSSLDDDEKTLQLGDVGLALHHVLHNPQTPSEIRNALMTVLNDMFNELPNEQKRNLELTEEYLVDLVSYHAEKQGAEETKERSAPLDLSEVCTEFLGTNEATAGAKPVDLATLLSAVMRHPDLPEKLHSLLSDELIHIPEDFSERPEVIQTSLEALRLAEDKPR